MSIFKKERAFSENSQRGMTCIADLPVELISPNPAQPRKRFDESSISELASSIASVGLIQPLIVRKSGNGYELIAGERRLRAVKQLGYSHVRCIIEARAESESALLAVIENLQREDLDFFEEAESCSALIDRFGMTQEELASMLGKSQSYVANKLRLLKLDSTVRDAVSSAGLTERHARALLAVDDPDLRMSAVRRIVKAGLSVKESERLVAKMKKEPEASSLKKRGPRIIRIFRDYRIFINTVNSACDQLKESGLLVAVEQNDLENGVEITIRVTQ